MLKEGIGSFADFLTLFDREEERNIEVLSKIYDDRSRLQQNVKLLLHKHVDELQIEGRKVLIKPNWVKEDAIETDSICLRTNKNLLLCFLEQVLSLHPQKVLIADAPIQGCHWDSMLKKDFLEDVYNLGKRYDVEVEIKDFRRTTSELDKGIVNTGRKSISDYVIFDVGKSSFLEPISTSQHKFRVTNYNPDKMAEVHNQGTHKYCIAKDVFDYDVIITMPKLKTHRMAGMTNALKILVGINGDKDFLPHHRVGSKEEGGDCYKNKNIFRTISNYATDAANRRLGKWNYLFFAKLGGAMWKLSRPNTETLENAGWYGNDTIWRTVLDINKIALYGDANGVLHQQQQRKLFSFMDGIIGGQGDGPLHPRPSALGIIGFSNNSYLMDVSAGMFYHLNEDKIPLLKAAREIVDNSEYTLTLNSKKVSLTDLKEVGIDIEMSPGWLHYND